MKLLRDLVLVKLAPRPKPAHGLIEAPAFDPVITYGKVIDVGPDVEDVAPNDIVAFGPTKGDPITIGTIAHLMIPEADIDMKLERTTE